MLVDCNSLRLHLYKSLPALTNLYRTASGTMVRSICKPKETTVMKRFSVWKNVLAIVVAMAALTHHAHAQKHNGWRHHAALGCNQSGLQLTSAQKAQVKSIWVSEKPAVGKLMSEFARENRDMQSLAAQVNPDPKRLQSIADQQGSTFSELLMEKEKLMMQFETQVLKPHQRAKVQAFENCLDGRIDGFAQDLSQ
jgi:Spy/CpxP family protein refolding chaperone